MKKIKINLNYLLFLLYLYGLIFQNLLQTLIPVFQYLDEFLALLFFPVFLINLFKNKNKKAQFMNIYEKKLLIALFIILMIGLLSNINNGFQSLKVILSDCIIFYKFYLVYFLTKILWKNEFWLSYENKIRKHLILIVSILFLLTLGNYIFDLYPGEVRFGVKSNQLFYTHSTYLAAVCLFILCLFTKIDKKVVNKYSIISILILVSTLRFKAIGTIIAILIIMVFVNKSNRKLSLSKITVIGAIIFVFAYDQINYYFFQNDGFARKALINASLKIAKDYLPLGGGFATYGSFYSAIEYSPLYSIYGISNVYGLSQSNPAFVADTFWAMIIGQFGYIGLCIYVICIYYIYKIIDNINFNSRDNKYLYISKLSALIYIIICSTSESAFAGPMAIPLAIILGI